MPGERRVLNQKIDPRGRVFEILRREEVPPAAFGQIYAFTAAPGAVKGNHFHRRKMEWFCVVAGEGELNLHDVGSGRGETFVMSALDPAVVRIPPGVAHSMANTGADELVVLAYVTEPFDPNDTDTYPYEVPRRPRQE